MVYRPYPNVDRAMAQLDRHAHLVEVPAWRVQLAADARRALAAGGEAVPPMVRALQGIRLNVYPAFAALARARHAA
ncbi:hypothetical protein [Streptomyces sp. NBC_01789]|uniref:hypothetical protein n=1 Tax=Streptomyces sp. NBC_01789 TaxID=2975941 RepID=UPI002250D243|nr:hypothetical protein [Streptomyces sp. NBC_01789]MCX4450742.1 hypothetical protein [Streptomyces sp. NBC_01789]